jgi:hypothetical protein
MDGRILWDLYNSVISPDLLAQNICAYYVNGREKYWSLIKQ